MARRYACLAQVSFERTIDQHLPEGVRSGPHQAGPVSSIDVEAGVRRDISLSARWVYTAHNSTQTLIPTTNGCDWSDAQEETSRVEDVQVLGQANQDGLEYSFGTTWPVDPFTTVGGTLTAEEVVG